MVGCRYDFLVHATGLTPPALLRATGLPTSGDGALLVDPFLRSVADPRVFGGGDCVALQGRELAKVGVYAVREAPVLCHNLLATLQGRPLRRFLPQRRFLLILNLGDGTGLLTWGPGAGQPGRAGAGDGPCRALYRGAAAGEPRGEGARRPCRPVRTALLAQVRGRSG
jgi:NADH dehydrogenase FAD-containing subunit